MKDWGKAGPVCTDEQAGDLLRRLFVQWPDQPEKYKKLNILELAISDWIARLKQWPYTYALQAITVVIDHNEFFPKWSEVRELMNNQGLRDQGGTPD